MEQLATAVDRDQIHHTLVDEVHRRIPVSGIHLVPLAPEPDHSLRPVLHLRDHDPDELGSVVRRAVEVLQCEEDLPDLFAQPGRVLRVEEQIGWRRWVRSSTYQEHFRHSDSARQLVLGLAGSGGIPSGFMAVCRSEREEAFGRAETKKVLSARSAAERAMKAFEVERDWARPVDDILDDLTRALPTPALLLDESQRVVWMNREAELRLGAIAEVYGSVRCYGPRAPALDELLHHVRRELDRPGASLLEPPPSWLLPGEALVVRRIARPGAPLRVLACLCAPPPQSYETPSIDDVRGRHRLSAREAEVALLATRGFSVVNIACRLNVAESTVRTHLKRIYRKLGVCSRAELAWRILGR